MVRSSTRVFPNFRRVDEPLQQLGVDTRALYREFGIRDRHLDGESGGVSLATYLKLLNRAAELSGRPFIGAEIALTRDVSTLGVMGYMMRNAPNFERCLAVVASYVDLVVPGVRARVVQQGDLHLWTYEVPGFTPEQSRHEVEMAMVQFVGAVREILSIPDWRPPEVFFRHAAPADTSRLVEALSDRLTFDHYFNGIAFPSDFLDRRISDADPRLLNILEQQVQRTMDRLKHSDSLLDRITFLLAPGPGRAEVSAERLASQLGMSRRTLFRRLSEQGISLIDVRQDVILRIAKETLCTTPVSVTELAQQLGYADASAFAHAFKRLTGLPPLAYRQRYSTAKISSGQGTHANLLR